jgi:hypothetical protein
LATLCTDASAILGILWFKKAAVPIGCRSFQPDIASIVLALIFSKDLPWT